MGKKNKNKGKNNNNNNNAAAAASKAVSSTEERRKADDGTWYTKEEFKSFFGGFKEWDADAKADDLPQVLPDPVGHPALLTLEQHR
ncbi:hypothetical protein DIPPA_10331 [Diplonema papillatum]|nr:hypothetical protein DIPPA_10298 [Diplonema papillatum]KAJ9465308.1 hypothetical protein DIPPA_10313 [Diplonema papillatum]KAJ9465309.1 hypothetical protein DIPPA_10295 [Diplonema papillatum]KAJ9465310.1 hypothetical protein DIPPA_10331 [Diplonema papillatum]